MYICTQITTTKHLEIMKTIETLRTENNELLTLSENLLKQFRKMMRVGNVNGAKLIYNRAEEVNAQRQSNIALILAM